MSRVKPYKAKRRIADNLALAQARDQAVEGFRRGLMEFFDRRKPQLPVRWYEATTSPRLSALQGRMEEVRYTALIEDESRPDYQPRAAHMAKYAREGAAIQMAKYLMANGFISEKTETIHGIGHRLTFTLYAAKVTE